MSDNRPIDTAQGENAQRYARRQFLKRSVMAGTGVGAAAVLGLSTEGSKLGAVAARAATASKTRGLRYRAVGYDTGSDYHIDCTPTGTANQLCVPSASSRTDDDLGQPISRQNWDSSQVAADFAALRDQLHCNAVMVFGSNNDRIIEASTYALRAGLTVVIEPRVVDFPQSLFLANLADLAPRAEALRQRYRTVILSLGLEFGLFAPGMVAGDTWIERLPGYIVGSRQQNFYDNLNAFLSSLRSVVRPSFAGPITYASTMVENGGPNGDGVNGLDWSAFDIVGVDDYYGGQLDYANQATGSATYASQLLTLTRWNKPIAVCEYGCRSFLGADVAGPSVFVEALPVGTVRSEQTQSDNIAQTVTIHEQQQLFWSSTYQFIDTQFPYSTLPGLDQDTKSYGIVKVVRDQYSDPASRFHWEPKLAFGALSGFFARYPRPNSAYVGDVSSADDDEGVLGLIPIP
jgi:hypothetical protein